MASPSTSARSAVEGFIEELRTRGVVVLDDLQRFRNELTVESLIPDAKAATTGALRIYRNELEKLLNNPDLGPDRDEWLRRFADQAIARTVLDTVDHPARSRVAEVLVEMEGQRRGSGYLVAPGWVLTAAHVVADATEVAVWLGAPEKLEPESGVGVDPQRILLAVDADLALLPVGQPSDGEVEPAPLARLDRTGVDLVPVVAAGFPRFKLRPAHGRPEVLRWDLHLTTGTIAVGLQRATETLELTVRVVPAEDPQPDQHSPWEGMSGAAVWASGRLVGVVAQQYPREGLGMLAVRPLAGLFEVVTAEQLAEWQGALPQLAGRAENLSSATLPPPEALQRDQVKWLPDSPATYDRERFEGTEALGGGFDADDNDDADRRDALGFRGDVNMLCSVLADRKARPPLSVGLFGEWGSGKSFFMALMRRRIEALAEAAYEAEEAGEETRYCSRVVQITFNAWHYMDANLWASLAVEIFNRLATPPPPASHCISTYRHSQQTTDECSARARRRQRVFQARKALSCCYALPNSDRGRPAVAVKQVRVSDLSGRQAGEDQFAKLIVHEHPQYQGPITLDVLPDEIGELPQSEQYVSIEVIQPGERSGQRALLSVDRFNQLASSGDMQSVLMNAAAEQQPQRAVPPRRRGRGTRNGQARGRRQMEWGLPHRGRISPEEGAYVREHLDEVQKLRAERGVPLIDPADPRMKERYGV